MKFSVWLEKKITGNQHKLDVAPPFGEITKADFEKLKFMKKKKKNKK